MSELRTQFQIAKRKRDGKMYNEYIRMSNDPTMPKMGIYERLAKKYGLTVTHTQRIILNIKSNEEV